MMSMRTMGCLVVLVLASGCGPALKRNPNAPTGSASNLPDAPLAQMKVQYDAAKLDAAHKYNADGQFTVSGLFFDKDGAAKDAIVKVSLKSEGGQVVSRAYEIELPSVAGTAAKVPMWDDGLLTVVIPEGDAPKPGFQTSNEQIKAVSLEQPGQAASTCYFGKEVLDGQIRFALCELQTDSPRVAFVDAVPDAPAAGPEAAPAGEAAPAAPETPKAN
ncbi:MAG TPA: hypothetical protein VMG12_24345 [Polyangiaceae bacterium]|nr:hypothetical protein [Polyangiaceae bacterium]